MENLDARVVEGYFWRQVSAEEGSEGSRLNAAASLMQRIEAAISDQILIRRVQHSVNDLKRNWNVLRLSTKFWR